MIMRLKSSVDEHKANVPVTHEFSPSAPKQKSQNEKVIVDASPPYNGSPMGKLLPLKFVLLHKH